VSDRQEVADPVREAYSNNEPWYAKFTRQRPEEFEDHKAKEASRLNTFRTPEYLLRRSQHR